MRWRTGRGDAYALLAALLLEAKGVDPPPEMARAPGGKPFFPTRPDLCFSLSHAGELALCVLGDREVGCDLELVRPRSPGLPRYCLSDREFAWFRDRGGCWEDFYTLWTLKEARVKCTGEGLVRPVREIAVPLLDPGGEEELDGFRFTSLWGEEQLEGELRGAVCEKM